MHKPGIVSTLKPHTRLCRHNLRKGEQQGAQEAEGEGEGDGDGNGRVCCERGFVIRLRECGCVIRLRLNTYAYIIVYRFLRASYHSIATQ